MSPAIKKILIFAVILAVLAILAITFFGKSNADPNLNSTVTTTTQSPTSGQSQKFLQSLSQIKSMDIDTTLLEDPAYLKLKDFTRPIVLEDQRLVGRSNPFAPIGSDTVFSEPESSMIQNPIDAVPTTDTEINTNQTPTQNTNTTNTNRTNNTRQR